MPRMSLLFDLHAHSTASDGTLTPTQLMQRAHAAGIGVMALTDHDSLAGAVRFALAARRDGLHAIFGAVQTSDWKGPMFIADEAMPVDSDGVDLTPFVLAALTFFHAFPPTRLEMPNGKCGWYSVYAA